jgi:hypothetical protein
MPPSPAYQNGRRSPYRWRRFGENLNGPSEGSDMQPHSPWDRHAFENLDFEGSAPTERSAMNEGTRYTARAMLIAFLILVVIVALSILI